MRLSRNSSSLDHIRTVTSGSFRIDLRAGIQAREMAMDFMDMREALKVAGCLAANGNRDFYGARPNAASQTIARAVPADNDSRHAALAACIGYGAPIAQSKRSTS